MKIKIKIRNSKLQDIIYYKIIIHFTSIESETLYNGFNVHLCYFYTEMVTRFNSLSCSILL